MLTVSRWEPFRDLVTIQNRLNRIFGDPTACTNAEEVGTWAPPVDVIEEPDRLVFRAEIPGVSKDDIDVKVENGTLLLRGEKKQVSEKENDTVHRVERFYGSFTRSFTLPSNLDAGKIEARYKDGVLELVIPKVEEAKPRKIAIQAA
jgi:HSP20 family protein